MPDRPLAIGAAGGSFATLILGLLREFVAEGSSIYTVGPSLADCVCEALDWDLTQRPGLQIFLSGILVGVCLGPLVDLIWICRQRWRRFITAATNPSAPNSRALYKVI